MSRRATIAALAVVATVAVAVPAVAGDVVTGGGEPRAAKKLEADARKVALKALRRANKALRRVRRGGGAGPQGPVGPAGPAVLASAFAQAPGAQTTASENSYVQLPGGPSVTLNVPASGTIQVSAQAFIGPDAGAVSLFEDGQLMAGQSDICEQFLVGTPGAPLFVSLDGAPTGGTWSTPASADVITGACASTGPASPVMFQTTPGQHTYELRYAYCGCAGADATFSQRKLWVTALGS